MGLGVLTMEAGDRRRGIVVKQVLTDNGACYGSHAFRGALGPQVKHKRTRTYRPQTSGNVERFNRTKLDEWAYVRPDRSGLMQGTVSDD